MWRQYATNFMKNNHSLIIMTLLWLSFQILNAQIKNPIASKAISRLEANKALYVVKPVPDELKEKLFVPIWTKAFQNMMSYHSDSLEMLGIDNLEENNDIIGNIKEKLTKASRPDSYSFDIMQEVALTDFNNRIHIIKLYYAPQQSYIGIEQTDSLLNRHIIIIDTKIDKWVEITESKSGNRHCLVQPIYRPIDQENMDVCELKLVSSFIKDGDTIHHYEQDKCGNQLKVDFYEMLLSNNYSKVYSNLNYFFEGIFLDINMAHQACVYGYEGKYKNFEDYPSSMKTKHISRKPILIATKEIAKK